MESDMKDPSERHSFLILLAPVTKECSPLIQYTRKKVTHVVSICINLDCMRVEFFFSICKTISRFYRVMLLYNTRDTAVMTVGAFHLPSGEL